MKEDPRYNTSEFFRLTPQKQKETAGIPEYARKGYAALSRENFSLQGKNVFLESFPKNRLCYHITLLLALQVLKELTLCSSSCYPDTETN